MIRLTVDTTDAMEALGALIAGVLGSGDAVALDGELGAGKTTLTRGLGAALGVRGAVTSPTFVLARTHPRADGEPPLVHVDAYRLGDPAELDDLDLDLEGSITVVEWAEGMLDHLTDAWLGIRIERPSEGDAESDDDVPRRVTITGHGARWTPLPRELTGLAERAEPTEGGNVG